MSRSGAARTWPASSLRLVTLGVILALSPAARSIPPGPRPDILLILVDDLGAGDIGEQCAGRSVSPNLERLAAEGATFASFYTNGAVCSPTRAGLQTGRYPQRFGIRRTIQDGTRRGLPPGTDTLGGILRDLGYDTHLVGKWQLGGKRGERCGFPEDLHGPLALGYDHFYGAIHPQFLGGSFNDPWVQRDSCPPVRTPGHFTDLVTDEAIRVLAPLPPSAPPTFLMLCHYAPHIPNELPPGWPKRCDGWSHGNFLDAVIHLDWNIGRLLAALNPARSTLVIFASDNGGDFYNHPDGNGPFRGWKGSFYEGGIRVPAMLRWTGVVAPGTVVEDPVITFDLLPTILDLLDVPLRRELDGTSFEPALIAGQPLPGRELLWENHRLDGFTYAVRRDHWKLVQRDGTTELFDLAVDPYETDDVAGSNPWTLSLLRGRYRDWRARTSSIHPTVAGTSGSVDVDGGTMTFHRGGGLVEIADEQQLDPMDGAFSVSLRATRDPGCPRRADALLAAKGTWTLGWRLDGRIEAAVGAWSIACPDALPLTAETRIVLTLDHPGDSQSPSSDGVGTATLYADGVACAQGTYVDPPLPTDQNVTIGNDVFMDRPFCGTLRDLRFANVSLTPEEVLP